jgi:hypothetical protein
VFDVDFRAFRVRSSDQAWLVGICCVEFVRNVDDAGHLHPIGPGTCWSLDCLLGQQYGLQGRYTGTLFR